MIRASCLKRGSDKWDRHLSQVIICHNVKVLQQLPSVWFDYLCTHLSGEWVWKEVDFSGVWLWYFCSNAVLKTYLLSVYSYRKCFIFISLKEKKSSCQMWFVWHVSACLKGTFAFALSVSWCESQQDATLTLTPYVLMPRRRVWFVPMVQRKVHVYWSACHC